MKKDNEIYLQDIKKAISKIEKYTHNVNYKVFQDADMRQDAVIRQFEIIGEAASQISQDFLEKHSDFSTKRSHQNEKFSYPCI